MVYRLKEEQTEKIPGVLIYFELRPTFRFMTNDQKGRLFEAILDYGELGQDPDFSDDPLLGAVWCFVRPRIDRDAEHYGIKTEQRKYAAYCREAKKAGITPLSFDEWKDVPEYERKSLLLTDERKSSADKSESSTDEFRSPN